VSATARQDATPDVLQWRVHPARDRLAAAFFALTVIAVVAMLSAALMQSLWWGGLAFAFQMVTLRRFFLPSEFRLDGEGVSASNVWSKQRYRWGEIRRFLCDGRGGFLSTCRQNSMLDLFRGMHLLFDDDRETVIARINERIGRETAA